MLTTHLLHLPSGEKPAGNPQPSQVLGQSWLVWEREGIPLEQQ